MTTRTFTPRPAPPAAKTTATGAMDGWRIEVREELEMSGSRMVRVTRSNGERVDLRMHSFVLSPQAINPSLGAEETDACVDPLFETIYVSRELTGDEPDTLRRLMAEECGRERGAKEARVRAKTDQLVRHLGMPESPVVVACAEGIVDMQEREREPLYMGSRQHGKTEALRKAAVEAERDGLKVSEQLKTVAAVGRMNAVLTDYGREFMARHAPPDPYESLQQALRADWDAQRKQAEVKSFSVSHAPVSDEAKRKAKAAMSEMLDFVAANPGAVTFAVYDGMRHWSCPKCKVMLVDVAVESRVFKCACGFGSEPAATAPTVAEPRASRAMPPLSNELPRLRSYDAGPVEPKPTA